MAEITRLVTAEELERLPGDDNRYELVEGRLVRMSPVGYQHGKVVIRIGFLLNRHLERRPEGVVVTEVGFKLASRPDTVRAPDIAFIRRDRVPSPDVRGFLAGAPDVAIEVLSPEDRPSDMRAKVNEYLTRGVSVVVVVDPEQEVVSTYRPSSPPIVTRAADEVVDLGDAVPGFRCRLREIFE
jgi:Uma2 family endonuclease